MVNTSDDANTKTRKIMTFLGKTLTALINGKVRGIDHVSQVKINCQPHYVYKSESGWVSILVDEVNDIKDVSSS